MFYRARFLPHRFFFIASLDVEPSETVEIDRPRIHPKRPTIVDLGPDINDNNCNNADIVGKEILRGGLSFKRPHTQIELRDDEQDTPYQPPDGGVGECPAFPRQLGYIAALDFPGITHPQVR